MSKTKRKSIDYSINEFMKQHKAAMSREHYYGMAGRLKHMFQVLHDLGYETTHIKRVKQKHVVILVQHWQDKGLAISTIKNRLSDLRFVCRAYRRPGVVLANDAYGIGQRDYLPSKNRAVQVDVNEIEDPYIQASVRLQQAFGLRREEALKIIPKLADKGEQLWLKPSWTKGGVERQVPIRTQEQRAALEQAKQLVGEKSLIPQEHSYIYQRRIYDRVTHEVGFSNLHGLRHAYAQKRYQGITGWSAPICGGPNKHQLDAQQFALDRKARQIIANELGHARLSISNTYLGSAEQDFSKMDATDLVTQ